MRKLIALFSSIVLSSQVHALGMVTSVGKVSTLPACTDNCFKLDLTNPDILVPATALSAVILSGLFLLEHFLMLDNIRMNKSFQDIKLEKPTE